MQSVRPLSCFFEFTPSFTAKFPRSTAYAVKGEEHPLPRKTGGQRGRARMVLSDRRPNMNYQGVS
jgi:hypothetical protein